MPVSTRPKWQADLMVEDPELRRLQRQLQQRLRQWEIRRVVVHVRQTAGRSGIQEACQRFGVSRMTVHRALRATGLYLVR